MLYIIKIKLILVLYKNVSLEYDNFEIYNYININHLRLSFFVLQ